ncbi:invertebrate-type lysozyme-like [Musca autumnalis]|uniref:invertebrate-type lysozyme-like n=1 Tax=Musca autumnalis TaxID=221902 RepID=UPI003CE8FEC3
MTFKFVRHNGQFCRSNHKTEQKFKNSTANKTKIESIKVMLLTHTDKPLESVNVSDAKAGTMDEKCFRCLCTTINDCKPVKCLRNHTCGIYEISRSYWIDSGKNVLDDNTNYYLGEEDEFSAYLKCVNNIKCSRKTVTKYMQRYQDDCNNDGIIDCRDFIALHLLGPHGCKTKPIAIYHKMRMELCLK